MTRDERIKAIEGIIFKWGLENCQELSYKTQNILSTTIVDAIGLDEDDRRLENLETTMFLVDMLLKDICYVSQSYKDPRYSINKMGKQAYKFILSQLSVLSDYLPKQ